MATKGATVGIQARVDHCHTIGCATHFLYTNFIQKWKIKIDRYLKTCFLTK
jgi:hypothetical protein